MLHGGDAAKAEEQQNIQLCVDAGSCVALAYSCGKVLHETIPVDEPVGGNTDHRLISICHRPSRGLMADNLNPKILLSGVKEMRAKDNGRYQVLSIILFGIDLVKFCKI